jgi:hypothetical protein
MTPVYSKQGTIPPEPFDTAVLPGRICGKFLTIIVLHRGMVKRPPLLTAVTILMILLGTVLILGWADLVTLEVDITDDESLLDILRYASLALGAVVLIFGLAILLGYVHWGDRTFAWYLGVVFSGLGMAMGVFSLIIGNFNFLLPSISGLLLLSSLLTMFLPSKFFKT